MTRPVTHAGGLLAQRELTLVGHWIHDATIPHWTELTGELTSEISGVAIAGNTHLPRSPHAHVRVPGHAHVPVFHHTHGAHQ